MTTPGAGVPSEELERAKQLLAAQDAALRDMHRQNTELAQRARDLDTRVTRIERPAPDPKDQNAEFWSNPVGVMKSLIKEEMDNSVKPLNQQFAMTAYERSKVELKKQYNDIWDKIEGGVDEFIRTAQSRGMEANDELLNIAALTVSGQYYRGEVAAGRSVGPVTAAPVTPTPPTRPQLVVDPPHMRPSAPQIPGREEAKPAIRELTENERRLARERGMTPEQYLNWLDVPPEGVIHSKLGKEAAK